MLSDISNTVDSENKSAKEAETDLFISKPTGLLLTA
jgi:hypothetical protein